MFLCKVISILKKETVDQLLRVSVCQEVFGKTVKVGKIGNRAGQIRTVHIATECECIFRSAREEIFNMAKNAIECRLLPLKTNERG